MFLLDHRAFAAAALVTVAILAAALLTAGAGGAPAGRVSAADPRVPEPAAAAAPAPRGHPLVELLRDHVVHAAPSKSARRIGSITARRPLSHVRTTLPVTGRTVAKGGGNWVHVRLPGRPNGHQGWISADGTRHRFTEWRIAIRLSTRHVTVTRHGQVQAQFRAVVGQASTPTPRGHFFIEEGLKVSRTGGPYALAASARSKVFTEFEGGDGQIALHGVRGLGGALGTAVSHGCVRLSARAMSWLAKRIPVGTPLTIV